MVDWWLIVLAVIVAFLTVGLVFYLVIVFSSEDDKNEAWLPKIVVVLSLSLACFNVLILPYEVANKVDLNAASSFGGGVDTVLLWQIVMYAIAGLTFAVVPFAMFYYESKDPDQENICNQIKPAIAYTTVTLAIFLILLFVLWIAVGKADIPYTRYSSVVPMFGIAANNIPSSYTLQYSSSPDDTANRVLSIKVSIFVYLVGLMSAVGWILFFAFGGVGLVAMPVDFIQMYRDRPIPITAAEYATKKAEIARESERLMDVGKKLDEQGRDGGNKKHSKKVAAFKIQVAELEAFYEKVEISYKEKGGEVLKAVLALIVGVFSLFLSIAWVLHIIVWNIAKKTPFLNSLFVALNNAFSLLGVLAYGIFSFYLLWCVVKGCTKVGINLLFFKVYPMKVNGTLMNSFLFNCILIMITSVSVVQFCSISFNQYAVNTGMATLFTTYVQRLKGIDYIVKYLQYPLIGVVVLSALWLLICPKRKVEDDDD